MPRRINSSVFPAGSESEMRALSELSNMSCSEEEVHDDEEEIIVMDKAIARVLSASSGNTKKSIISIRGSVSSGRVAFAF
jgi:hypothetical protein